MRDYTNVQNGPLYLLLQFLMWTVVHITPSSPTFHYTQTLDVLPWRIRPYKLHIKLSDRNRRKESRNIPKPQNLNLQEPGTNTYLGFHYYPPRPLTPNNLNNARTQNWGAPGIQVYVPYINLKGRLPTTPRPFSRAAPQNP